MKFIDWPRPTTYQRQVRRYTIVLPLGLTSLLDDILHVRLQTLGVTEHAFDINVGGNHYTWILYDVGGAVRCSHPRPYSSFVDVSLILVERPGEQTSSDDNVPRLMYYTAARLGTLLRGR
jgi:hypothetical protein